MQIVTAFAVYNEGNAVTLKDVSAYWIELKRNAETYKWVVINSKIPKHCFGIFS